MPLFAHWRRPNRGGGGAGAAHGEGCTAVAAVSPTTSSFVFCPFNAAIEQRLQTLHARQRVHGDVQSEIDMYLVACIARRQQQLVLPRQNVPHYDNLPDISAYAVGILDPSMDADP